MLVRSKVFAEDKTSPAPFVVTPPLFRLDGGQQSRLRIVKTDTSQQVKGRESLNWLCVTGIPPKSGDAWGSKDANAAAATLNVQVSVGSCLKLIERPASVDGHPEDEGGKLSWRLNGGHLTVTNPTPYYMNLTNVMIGGVPVEKLDYVAPGGSRIFNVSPGAARNIVWQVVTDFGGKSRSWTAAL
jgi:P pilus assembly chaperone PapD